MKDTIRRAEMRCCRHLDWSATLYDVSIQCSAPPTMSNASQHGTPSSVLHLFKTPRRDFSGPHRARGGSQSHVNITLPTARLGSNLFGINVFE